MEVVMKHFKNLMAIGFVIFSMLLVSDIYAADKSDEQGKEAAVSLAKHRGMEGKRQQIWDQLNLTAEQKKQLEENKAKNRDNMKATFEKMRSYRDSLKDELMKPELDMNKINGIQSQIKSLQSQIVDDSLNSILDVRKILTHEQFEKFITITRGGKIWRGKGDKDVRKGK
jgi:Spy/CpxP family protein refolding chaperone